MIEKICGLKPSKGLSVLVLIIGCLLTSGGIVLCFHIPFVGGMTTGAGLCLDYEAGRILAGEI